jgi:hypothetical protein
MDLVNLYDHYEISVSGLPKICGFENKQIDVKIEAWPEYMRDRLVGVFWPRFCQALAQI